MERMEALTNYYTTHNEDARLTPKRGMVEFLTTIHYVEKYLKPGMRILEIGAGTGRYSHYFAQNGYAVDAVELMECNIEVFKANTKDGENITVQQGDAVNLRNIASDQYDITLLLGPMYHLYTDEDKHAAMSEAIRVTDWLGLVPLFVCMGFGILGLVQWIKRKSIRKVDYDILILGGFYIITIAAYLLFESVVINYRPVLIGGILEASYPSSTTMLVMCVMPTAIMQLKSRIKNKAVCNIASVTIIAFIAFMVIGRLISGVHWFTDIVGGALLSAGLVMLYYSVCKM